MTTETFLDRWGAGWRGPLLAAVLALVAGLPGVLALPPLDRDESRFAEASAQMLESGDFVSIHFQATPRFKKPVGIYWLQAATVKTLSLVEDRGIWAYRVPSLLGAMLAAGACAWGAAAFLRPGSALVAGALMASSFILSTEASIAATDAVLCGTTTLAMAALGRIYLAERGGRHGRRRRAEPLFWGALALAILVKGPIAPMVVALTLAALCLWERRGSWVGRLGWGWGLIVLAAVLGPWALAITVTTDERLLGRGGGIRSRPQAGWRGRGTRRAAGLLPAARASVAVSGHPAAAGRGGRRLARPERAGGSVRPVLARPELAGLRGRPHQTDPLHPYPFMAPWPG